jgi:hypothetical protein
VGILTWPPIPKPAIYQRLGCLEFMAGVYDNAFLGRVINSLHKPVLVGVGLYSFDEGRVVGVDRVKSSHVSPLLFLQIPRLGVLGHQEPEAVAGLTIFAEPPSALAVRRRYDDPRAC